MFGNPCRPAKTDQQYLPFCFLFPSPVPPKKKSTTHPKTSPHQDLLITNALTQVQIPWTNTHLKSFLPSCGNNDLHSLYQTQPDVCPRNGPGLPDHPTQSGVQPVHPPPLPRIDVKRSTRMQNPLQDISFSFFCSVSDVSPPFALSVFQVPLTMVHPRLEWVRVVKPSCVMMVEPCMCSSHRKDFCWNPTQHSPLSDVGSGSFKESSRHVILVLESVIRDGWFVVSGGGSSSQDTGDGETSGRTSQVPVTYFCDHSFSKSMTVCSSGEGCFPEEVRSVSQLIMNVEMTGCRYRVVILPICESLLLVISSSSLSNGNPVWTVVIHIVWSFAFCWSVKALHSSLELRMMVSPPPAQSVLGLWRCIGNPVVFRPSPRPSSLLSPLPCWHHLSPAQHSCGPVWTSRSYRLLVLSALSDFCLVCSSNPSTSFYWFLPDISDIVSRPGGLGVHVDVLWRMLT